MATCAICMNPIVTRDDVRVSDTEVVHADCARRGGRTLTSNLRQEITDVRAQLATALRRIGDLTHDVGKAETETRHARRMVDSAVRGHRATIKNYQDAIEDLTQRLAASTAALEAATAAARPERTTNTSVSQQPAPDAGRVHTPQEATTSERDHDPAEVRFSLLEFDPL